MRKLYSFAKKLKDKIPGGLADKKSPDDFDSKALSKGVKVELEHTSDREVATEIAMDHLTEDPEYYEKLAVMEGEEKEKPKKSHKELLGVINAVRERVKDSDVYKDMCKEHGVSIDYIDVVPMAFDDINVSARTNKGCIYFNYALLNDGDFDKEDHYMIHEMVHHFQQCFGDGPTEGSTKDDYLDNEYEQEGFQAQTEYLSETRDDETAEEYVDKVLDHHEVPEKEREKRRNDLLNLASSLWLSRKIAEGPKEEEEEEEETYSREDVEVPDFAAEYPKWSPEAIEKQKEEYIERHLKEYQERKDLTKGGKIIAYHGGRKFEGGFNFDFLGSGEGAGILGPGFYFITEKDVAKAYCKYVEESTLYTVEIDAEGIYGMATGFPLHLRDRISDLEERIAKEHGEWSSLWGRYRLPVADSFKYGQGFIGSIVKMFGAERARAMLLDIGITGVYTKIPVGIEIVAFDPSIITIVDKEECIIQ